VYRSHLGQKLSPTSSQSWEQAILKDFDDLKEAGVVSPDIARIKKMMGAGQGIEHLYYPSSNVRLHRERHHRS
jgi:hypothetical protein